MKRHWWAFDQTDPMQGYEFVPWRPWWLHDWPPYWHPAWATP
jgi:hypothetical protein